MKLFDESFEVKCNFFDFSQAFDQMGHDCFISKLTQDGILRNLLNLLLNFLMKKNKECKILINQVFTWTNIDVKVPLGSNFGPLLSLTSINSLTIGLYTNAKIFSEIFH